MKHFSSPINVGEMEDPDAVTDVHYKGQGCFDKVRIFLKTADDKVEKVSYQTRGCSGTIAACSAMSEMVVGMPVAAIPDFDGDKVADYLGGVPERKKHSMDLAAEALRTVVEELRGGE